MALKVRGGTFALLRGRPATRPIASLPPEPRPGRRFFVATVALVLVACALAAATSAFPIPGGRASASDGDTITVPDPNGNHQPSLELDAVGNPVVSYRRDAIGSGLAVLHCGNPACTAGNSITTADPAIDVGYLTSLALDAAGNPVVSYIDRINVALKVLHCGNGNCTAGNTITSPDTGVEVYSPTSLVLDAAGNPIISYTDWSQPDDANLKVLHCGDPACAAGNIIASPDTTGNVGFGASLTLDTGGDPVVAYVDATNHDLKVLHCGDPNCSAGNSIAVADPVGGEDAFLVLDAAGNPVVSYYDGGNTNLKVLHCGNPNCSAGNTITSPDTTGAVGQYTSLTLDAAGNPVVSYHDVTNSDLKVLHCGNPSCSAGNAIASLDTANSSGWWPSIALDGGGNPVVSYSDPLVGLKVLRCADANCGAVAAATPTPAPGQDLVWGDDNCSGAADPVDSLLTLRHDAGLSTNTGDCPAMAQVVDVANASPHPWGDVDCGGDVNPIDSLKLLRFDGGLPIAPVAGCPDIGDEVQIN